jgi:hypothetical protein
MSSKVIAIIWVVVVVVVLVVCVSVCVWCWVLNPYSLVLNVHVVKTCFPG